MILNPFATDAFDMVALTAAINKIPNTYGRLEQLNLMTPTGVRTRTIIIEEMRPVAYAAGGRSGHSGHHGQAQGAVVRDPAHSAR